MNKTIHDFFIPLDKNKFIEELKSKGIPEATIENIDWKKCINDGYCVYNDKIKNKTCFTKIKNKNNKLCSIHKNKKHEEEVDEINNMIKDIYIDKMEIEYDNYNSIDELDNISDTICDTEILEISDNNLKSKVFHLNDKNIENLLNELQMLMNDVNNYKKGKIDINNIFDSLLKYNKNIYNLDHKPHICISFLLQFFEELYEISNDFFRLIINDYNDFNVFIDLCKKWKKRIKEITQEIIQLPEYYKEYYVIINDKIDNNLFNISI